MAKKYAVVCEIAEFASTGSTTNLIREISWFDGEPKIDIGKWVGVNTETEYRKSGLALTVSEANDLTETLVREGFGVHDKVVQALKDRKVERVGETKSSVKTVDNTKVDYYDPKEMLV